MAIRERDEALTELKASLKSVTENRDQLQRDYAQQADALSSHVQLLQDQLRQVLDL